MAFIEVPMTDGFGNPRGSVVCGAGVQANGDTAQTAVIYDDPSLCEQWPPVRNEDTSTEIKFSVSRAGG